MAPPLEPAAGRSCSRRRQYGDGAEQGDVLQAAILEHQIDLQAAIVPAAYHPKPGAVFSVVVAAIGKHAARIR